MRSPIEHQTQNRIIKLFSQQLGYVYYGNWDNRTTKLIQ
jgi:type I restriction enzyme R subunit